MLIIVCGLPGSGKSTLARALAKRLRAAYISSDLTRRKMFKEPAYSEAEKEAVYNAMAGRAEDAVRSGMDAVVDATFYLKKERERYAEIARNAAAPAFTIVCKLDEEEAKRRLGRRYKDGPSDADYQVYLKLKDRFEPVEGPHLEVDTSMPKEEMLKRTMDYLGR